MTLLRCLTFALCAVLPLNLFAADDKAGSPDPAYLELRSLVINNETSVAVSNLVLKRDIGTFTFRAGTFYFAATVEGKITGAVFIGDGTLAVAPVLESEKRSLGYLTKGQPMLESFSEVVLRFTDGTAEEIK